MKKYIAILLILPILTSQLFANQRNAFMDIPTLAFALSAEAQQTPLGQQIKKYHELDKQSLEALPLRISALDEIHASILAITKNFQHPSSKGLQKLDNLVQKKSWYLKEIKALYDNPAPFKKYIYPSVDTPEYQPLYLINHVQYDFKLPIYWGLFWLEAIDPCHRFLTGHYLKWQDAKTKTPFFLWLEDQEIPFNAIQVDYLQESEITNHEVSINNGLLTDPTTKLPLNYDDKSTEYIFSLTCDQKFIALPASENTRHTSVTRGLPVLGAGAIKIKDGKLIYIDAESGHYQPTPAALLQVIRWLEKQNAELDLKTLQVKYYTEEGQVVFETAAELMEKYKSSKAKNVVSTAQEIKNFKF